MFYDRQVKKLRVRHNKLNAELSKLYEQREVLADEVSKRTRELHRISLMQRDLEFEEAQEDFSD